MSHTVRGPLNDVSVAGKHCGLSAGSRASDARSRNREIPTRGAVTALGPYGRRGKPL
jgi:hypothetical protein